MEFRYSVTREEFVGLQTRLSVRCLRRLQKPKTTGRFFGLIFLWALCSFLFIGAFRNNHFVLGIPVGVILFLTYACIHYRIGFIKRITNSVAQMFRLLPEAANEFVVTIDEVGLSAENDALSQRFRWAYVDDIVDTPYGLEIDALGGSIMLPERLFKSPSEKSELKTAIEALWEAGRKAA